MPCLLTSQVFPASDATTAYDTAGGPRSWHNLEGYTGSASSVVQTCQPLPDFDCNETLYGISTYNASEDAEVLPMYAFNVTSAQYGRQLDFTLCTQEIDGFSAYLALYGSCAAGNNDTFFAVPANASDADGFCATDGRVLEVTVGRALHFNGLQFFVGGGARGMAYGSERDEVDLTLVAGETYLLNQSDPSNHGYELGFSLNRDGVWAENGTEYDPAEAGLGEMVRELLLWVLLYFFKK